MLLGLVSVVISRSACSGNTVVPAERNRFLAAFGACAFACGINTGSPVILATIAPVPAWVYLSSFLFFAAAARLRSPASAKHWECHSMMLIQFCLQYLASFRPSLTVVLKGVGSTLAEEDIRRIVPRKKHLAEFIGENDIVRGASHSPVPLRR